jgi:hypothetical protein
MVKREFTFLKEVIERYQQKSSQVLMQAQRRTPEHFETLAVALEGQSNAQLKYLATTARSLKEVSQDIFETLYLTNDLLCDKATDLVTQAEQSIQSR